MWVGEDLQEVGREGTRRKSARQVQENVSYLFCLMAVSFMREGRGVKDVPLRKKNFFSAVLMAMRFF